MHQTTKALDIPTDGKAEPLKTVTYVQSKTYVLSTMGGFLVIALIKAYLFRFDHPDIFYEILATVVACFMGVLFWFPPKLVLSSEGVIGSSFGRKWLDLPWASVASIDMFQTPVVQAGASRTGGRRALGIRVKPEFRGKIRPRSNVYGYDAAIVSMWDFSIDRVAEQCLAFWHAQGGVGEIISRLETRTSHQLQLSSS